LVGSRVRTGWVLKMRPDYEESIIQNPALGTRAYWHLARMFAERGDGSPPILPHFILAGGMLFHESTVQQIKSMNFSSGILKAVADRPEITAGLQARVETTLRPALVALQVGTACGILLREGGPGFPAFRAIGNDLPKGIREMDGQSADVLASAKRLGAWFSLEDLSTTQRRLRVVF
jgi:hypothetical protein